MDDAKYVLLMDTIDKKKTARGYYKKVRGGGKYVKMPSDTLTEGEKKKMNGPVVSYNLTQPYTWGEFKKLPDHIQVEYFRSINRAYTTNAAWLGEMFGVSSDTVIRWMKAHNIKSFDRGGWIPPEAKERWKEFIKSRETPQKNVSPNTEKEHLTLTPIEPAPKESVEMAEKLTEIPVSVLRPNIADLIAALSGTGAKLTIEVVL